MRIVRERCLECGRPRWRVYRKHHGYTAGGSPAPRWMLDAIRGDVDWSQDTVTIMLVDTELPEFP